MQLPGNPFLVSIFPGPNPFQEFFTAQFTAIHTLFSQVLFNNILRSNTGVIAARQPQGVIALHPAAANQDVLDGIIQSMAHMQRTGNVRWWYNYGKRSLVWVAGSMEIITLEPKMIPFYLHCIRIINRRQHVFSHNITPSYLAFKCGSYKTV